MALLQPVFEGDAPPRRFREPALLGRAIAQRLNPPAQTSRKTLSSRIICTC
jgi:hypothetical protein